MKKCAGIWLDPREAFIVSLSTSTISGFEDQEMIERIECDILLRMALIVVGSYATYTLGANNVANVTAVFVGAGQLSVFSASLVAGLEKKNRLINPREREIVAYHELKALMGETHLSRQSATGKECEYARKKPGKKKPDRQRTAKHQKGLA